MLRCAGLDERDVRRVRLERDELGPVDLDDWSGIILGGGPWNVSDPEDDEAAGAAPRRGAAARARAAGASTADFPFLGACYGIGTLGTLRRRRRRPARTAEPIGAVTITLTRRGRADPLLGELPRTFDAFLGHKEAVSTGCRDGAVLLASSPTCPVQAFRLGQQRLRHPVPPRARRRGHHACASTIYRHFGYFEPPEGRGADPAMAAPPRRASRPGSWRGSSSCTPVDRYSVGRVTMHRARRRPDRRRRSVRHRRGLPAARAPAAPGRVAVLEAREASGGTWDLFRYPGIRSDSDMFTFGFSWRPWPRRPRAGRRAVDPRLPAHRRRRSTASTS